MHQRVRGVAADPGLLGGSSPIPQPAYRLLQLMDDRSRLPTAPWRRVADTHTHTHTRVETRHALLNTPQAAEAQHGCASPAAGCLLFKGMCLLIQLTSLSPSWVGASHLLRLLATKLADRMGVCWNFLSPFVSGNRKASKGRQPCC